MRDRKQAQLSHINTGDYLDVLFFRPILIPLVIHVALTHLLMAARIEFPSAGTIRM